MFIPNPCSRRLLQHFGDTLHGLQSIRAFRAEDAAQARFVAITNKSQATTWIFFVVSRWLSTRLDLVASALLLAVSLFAALSRSALSPGLIGVALAQGLQVGSMVYAISLQHTLHSVIRVLVRHTVMYFF